MPPKNPEIEYPPSGRGTRNGSPLFVKAPVGVFDQRPPNAPISGCARTRKTVGRPVPLSWLV